LLSLIAGILMAIGLYGQQRTLSGTVFDETGQPFQAVTVMVRNTTRGTMTDVDGKFDISVASDDVLVVCCMGYKEVQIAVGDKNNIRVKLEPDAVSIDETMIVAYGTQRKASIIGSISTVRTEDLQSPVGNLSSGLAGKLPGIVVMQRSGEPGQGADFHIRGVSSFGANTSPLVIVDGIERDMDLVDADDIASFSILKDATATALYGVRGANGIVIITTKRGSESAPKVSAKVEYGLTQPVQIPKMADTEQWLRFYNNLYMDASGANIFSDEIVAHYMSGDMPDLYPSVDWVNTIFKKIAQTGKFNVNVSGGGRRIRYFVAGSYYTEGGIFNVTENEDYNPQISFDKFSIRSNIDIDVTKSTVLNISMSTQETVRKSPASSLSDIYSDVMRATPIATPTRFSDGTLAAPYALSGVNPYNDLNSSGSYRSSGMYAQSLVSLTQDFSGIITEGLKANVKFSCDANNSNSITKRRNASLYYLNLDTPYNADGTPNYVARNDGTNYLTMTKSNSSSTVVNLEASVNYERNFAQAHRVGAMFLFSYRSRTNNVPSSYLYAFPYRNMGVAGRATYSYEDRYFGEFNFGYNGSENFAPGHRFGFFPSFALGYMISNERFWATIRPIVSNLKIKASWGKVGNDQIGGNRRYAYNTTMNTNATGATFGTNAQNHLTGITTGDYGNPNVSWEEATKTNVGVELGLFDEVSLTFDYFHDLRKGIFIQRQSTPSVVGMTTTQYVNLGKMVNRGYELSANWLHRFSEDFTLSLKANYSFNRNRKLYDDKPDQVWKYQNEVGFAYNQQFGLIAEGLFESQEDIDNWPTQTFNTVRPGDIKYRDVNSDGVIDQYDMIPIGYTTLPEINYGFGLDLKYKKFDFGIFFSGVSNVTRIIKGSNLSGASSNIQFLGQIFSDVAENMWTLENPNANAIYPRLSMTQNTNNSQASTYWLRDMSFLRLKTLEVGYKFKKSRIYFSGNNVLTFAKFKLWDPELDANYGNAYPQMRTFVFGVNVNF